MVITDVQKIILVSHLMLTQMSCREECFLNGPTPASFSFIFVFSDTHYNFYNNKNAKNCPSSIWCWDLNSRPLEYESPTITTRPGLPQDCREECYHRNIFSIDGNDFLRVQVKRPQVVFATVFIGIAHHISSI